MQSCLFTAGRASFTPNITEARIAKTHLLVNNPDVFFASLRYDLGKLTRMAARRGLTPAVRLNGTSDLPKMARAIAAEFPTVQFYDYTKIPAPWKRTLENYHLTFSHSENNLADCMQALEHGVNVAVVFGISKSQPLSNDVICWSMGEVDCEGGGFEEVY
jgi:hypothetical protein